MLQSKQNSHFTAVMQAFKGSFLLLTCLEFSMDGQLVKLWLSLCVLSLLSGFVPITGYTCLSLYRVTEGADEKDEQFGGKDTKLALEADTPSSPFGGNK